MTAIGIRHVETGLWWMGPLYPNIWTDNRDQAAVFSSASRAIAIALTKCATSPHDWRWQRLPMREVA